MSAQGSILTSIGGINRPIPITVRRFGMRRSRLHTRSRRSRHKNKKRLRRRRSKNLSLVKLELLRLVHNGRNT